MKYLLVLAVLMVAFYVWRNNRREAQKERPPTPPKRSVAGPVHMVACRVCGTHLPQDDAVQGREGSYCSTDHRQRIEGPSG